MKSVRRHATLITAAIGISFRFSALAATVIYNNSTNDLVTRFSTGGSQIGDQIVLSNPEARWLSRFSFEFYGTNTANPFAFAGANVQAQVRFYLNDGPLFNGYATPGTMFYDSGLFAVGGPTSRSTFIFAAGSDWSSGGLFVNANEMTWTVQFSGLGGTDELGVDLYSPPVIGGNYPDYWEFTGGSWKLMTNTLPMSFGAYAEAVPEPSGFVLSLLGVSLLGFIRWRRNAA